MKYKAIFTFLVFVALAILERLRPYRRARGAGMPRLGKNIGLWGINLALSVLVVVPLSVFAAAHGLGWRTGVWASWPVDFLILDLYMYWWHRANHEIPFLWRFHVVHHLDRQLDTTTALRFHFGEVFFSAVLRGCVIAAFGVSISVVLAFEALVLAVTLFHHSNIRVPDWLDRPLSLLVVTPSIHWVHHHAVRADTDSNYATVLSVWDRLFRSRSHQRRDDADPIGVQARPPQAVMADEEFTQLVKRPFISGGREE